MREPEYTGDAALTLLNKYQFTEEGGYEGALTESDMLLYRLSKELLLFLDVPTNLFGRYVTNKGPVAEPFLLRNTEICGD